MIFQAIFYWIFYARSLIEDLDFDKQRPTSLFANWDSQRPETEVKSAKNLYKKEWHDIRDHLARRRSSSASSSQDQSWERTKWKKILQNLEDGTSGNRYSHVEQRRPLDAPIRPQAPTASVVAYTMKK